MLQLSRVDWRKSAVGLGAVVIMVLGFWAVSAWRQAKAVDPLKGFKPGVYHPPAKGAGDTLPLPTPAPRR